MKTRHSGLITYKPLALTLPKFPPKPALPLFHAHSRVPADNYARVQRRLVVVSSVPMLHAATSLDVLTATAPQLIVGS